MKAIHEFFKTKTLNLAESAFPSEMLDDGVKTLFNSFSTDTDAAATIERLEGRRRQQDEAKWQLQQSIAQRQAAIQRLEAEYGPRWIDLCNDPAERYRNAMPLLTERLQAAQAYKHCIDIARKELGELEAQLAKQEESALPWDLLKNLSMCAAGLKSPDRTLAEFVGMSLEALDEILAPAREKRQTRDAAIAAYEKQRNEKATARDREYLELVYPWLRRADSGTPMGCATRERLEAEEKAKRIEDAKTLTNFSVMLKRLFPYSVAFELQDMMSLVHAWINGKAEVYGARNAFDALANHYAEEIAKDEERTILLGRLRNHLKRNDATGADPVEMEGDARVEEAKTTSDPNLLCQRLFDWDAPEAVKQFFATPTRSLAIEALDALRDRAKEVVTDEAKSIAAERLIRHLEGFLKTGAAPQAG